MLKAPNCRAVVGMMKQEAPQDSSVYEIGPHLGWVLVDLAASEATGVLRTVRPRGPASIHFQRGLVTRVQADDIEPLVAFLVRKQLLSAAEMRSAICEIEHLDITLAAAFERLGLMDVASLDRLRARRTREALEEITAVGARVFDFEERYADGGPPVEVAEPVLRALVRSGAAQEWLASHQGFEGTLVETETMAKIRPAVVAALGEDVMPRPDETMPQLAVRLGDQDMPKVAALLLAGLLELQEYLTESPEHLEERAVTLDATEEACRLLIRASELYDARGDAIEARRAALSALRRRPTSAAPLVQVERLCARASEVATLELVYELVNGAMPGPYGRRALLYRAGRIFETEFADVARAREYYRRAVSQAPESGAALDALRRTSLALGDMATVADAYTTVGLANSNPAQAQSWLQKAADIARRSGDEARALAILAQAERIVEPRRSLPDANAEAPGPDEIEPIFEDEAGDAQPEAPPQASPVDPTAHDSATWGRMLLEPIDEAALDAAFSGDQGGAQGEVLLVPRPHASGPAGGEPARPTPQPQETLEELCGVVALFPSDLERLRSLRERAGRSPGEPAAAAAASLFALLDAENGSAPLGRSDTMTPLNDDLLYELATPPDTPEARALALLWKVASQLVTKDLADFGVGRAIPQKPGEMTPATRAFTETQPLVPVEPVRLLHMASGPVARVVLSRPLSLLTGSGGLVDSPDLRFRIVRCVAMCHRSLVLPCLMGTKDLNILLQAINAAFGRSPPRGSLHFVAASLAQDLWTAVPRSAQGDLRDLLAESESPDIDALKAEALAAAHRIALLLTGDAAAAIRTAVADDPFLAGTDPTTDEGLARAIERSEQVADLVRLALWPRYWQLRLGIDEQQP
jgi:tetratricopeptide (TPR) repeat protein